MPAGTPATKRRVPGGLSLGCRLLPQSEIARVLLFITIRINAVTAAGDVAREIDFGKLSVIWKRGDAIIDRAVRPISVVGFQKPLDQSDHLGNVTRCPRNNFRSLE